MVTGLSMYPDRCRENIRRIEHSIGVSCETAYSMMLMTSLLMDLHPEDQEVVDMILEDCGYVEEDQSEPVPG